ncbi:MAG: hypothetical protein LBR80_18230 [Deltaproteobacteria bacterium]|nr:hypothetical protein [Deltaproteobacteria bacterium]
MPVHVTVVYSAGIGTRPPQSCPGEHLDTGCLHFTLGQIFPEDILDMATIVQEIRAKITHRKPDSDDFGLSPVDLIRLWLAPLGSVPDVPWETGEDYLTLGRELSEMTQNWDILGMMIRAVIVRDNICTKETIARFKKDDGKNGFRHRPVIRCRDGR